MGDTVSVVAQWGPWAVVLVLIAEKVLPKIAPDLVKKWSQRASTEEMLFKLLERILDGDEKFIETLAGLKYAVEGLGGALIKMDGRLTRVEEQLSGNQEFLEWFRSLPQYKASKNR